MPANINGNTPHVNGTQYTSYVPATPVSFDSGPTVGNQVSYQPGGPIPQLQSTQHQPLAGYPPPPTPSSVGYSTPSINGATQPPPPGMPTWPASLSYPLRPPHTTAQGQQMSMLQQQPPVDGRRIYPQQRVSACCILNFCMLH